MLPTLGWDHPRPDSQDSVARAQHDIRNEIPVGHCPEGIVVVGFHPEHESRIGVVARVGQGIEGERVDDAEEDRVVDFPGLRGAGEIPVLDAIEDAAIDEVLLLALEEPGEGLP